MRLRKNNLWNRLVFGVSIEPCELEVQIRGTKEKLQKRQKKKITDLVNE